MGFIYQFLGKAKTNTNRTEQIKQEQNKQPFAKSE